MHDAVVNHTFPPWDVMITLDVAITAMAAIFSGLFVAYYGRVRRPRMKLGVVLLLAAFGAISMTYIADLYIMLALPRQIGMSNAMAAMARLHNEASWYLNTLALFLGVFGIYFVVSAFAQQTKALQSAVAETARLSEQKATFFASMSHEFRTPLNAVIGFAGLIRDKQLDEDPKLYHEYGKIITNSGNMMLGLVNDLLDLARIEAGQLKLIFEKIDLRELVETTTKTMTQLAVDAGVSLNVQMPDDLPPIDADRRSLEQIMLNLLSNAIKYTPEFGSISVTAKWRDRGLDTESAVLIVSDTGIGMPPSLVEKVFDPYVQGDPIGSGRKRGTGLGLPVCQRLVAAHDGEIAIKSTVGEGTVVTVTLPTLLASRERMENGGDLQRYSTNAADGPRSAEGLAA